MQQIESCHDRDSQSGGDCDASAWEAVLELASGSPEKLREDGEFVYYRNRQPSSINGTLTPTLVVAPLREHTAPRTLRRMEHEYSLRAELDPAWAARPLALASRQGNSVLVLEDPGGEPLERLVGGPMEVRQFLRLAVGLSAALGRVHQSGLIHKDIKPANALVNPASGQVWLTGFGIASRLPRERQSPDPPEFIAGTLAYMAPEQTGRMNRSIDSRSDLYSLGVTLYEMLTGSLPFTASDPVEWVHCHIARQPVPPIDRSNEVPAVIPAIILRLLAKTAEERYQTAAGLEADLRRCLTEWEALRRIDTFALGAHDTSDRLLMPEKLYGRDREGESLLAAFDQVVATGTPVMVLVSGYSGIGKSSVVHELHKAIVLPRGIFISGKYDQYKRDIPYATFAHAFRTFIRQILSESEAAVDRWRNAIREALGANGQLMVNLIGELEFVIGKQPPVAELPAVEAESRFHMVFRSFLMVFADSSHPLAIFLDDLQWLDAATLKLLEHLITHPDVKHVLIIGAFRDNEVSPSHPLMRTLDAIRATDAVLREIVLAPLSFDDVTQFVADTLHCEHELAKQLAQLVYDKTLGNPFFAIQFLTALAEEGLLVFEAGAAAWTWNLARIRAKGYTDNVVDLMVGKLKRLSDTTQERVKQLACLGNTAEIDTLTLVHGVSEEEIHAALWEAVRTGLIFRQDGGYSFLHDRVQEAAYALIPETERPAIHLRIGRLLGARTSAEKLEDAIFEIVNQLNRGVVLITEQEERKKVAQLNLIAGRRAKASTAYASACAYLRIGMTLLGRDGLTSCYEIASGLWLERAECEYLSGNFGDAERHISELLARGGSKIEMAAAYRIKIDLHVMKSENRQAIESALECLRLFGIEMPPHPTLGQVETEYEKVWSGLGERPIESLIDLPLMTDPEMSAAMRVLSVLYAPALFTDINLVYLFLCHMVNVSLKFGTTDASTPGFAWFGVILGPAFHRYTDGYRFGRLAVELVEKHKIVAYKAKTYFSMEMVSLWTQPPQTAIEYIRSAFRAGVETGDRTIACYSCNHLLTDLLLRGSHLDEVWQETARGLDFARKAKFRDVVDVIVSQQRFIRNMRGQTTHFSTFSDAWFDEQSFEAQLTEERMATMVCWYWILKLQARFMSGDYGAALAAARKAKELLWSSDGHIQLLDYHYYTALAIAASYDTFSPDRQREWREILSAHLRQLEEWAQSCAPTFRDKHALVAAETARLDGRELDAQRLYEEAIALAREHGFVQNEGIAGELAARFYAARGFETSAQAYLRNARYCYLRWGAEGKVRQLDESYSHLRTERSAPASSTIGASIEHLDLTTVIKIYQAVSGEIVLEKLIDTLMRTALEHAGSQRGLLIIPHAGAQRLEAEATTSRDTITVRLRPPSVLAAQLPESVLQYVLRTQETVCLDDASAQESFSADGYIRRNRIRSVLCLPLIKQATLIGVLYLENNLAPRVFTPARGAVLKLLASQAAISLENAYLFTDLQQENSERRRAEEALRRSEAYLADAQTLSQTGSFGWNTVTGEIYWSAETFRIFEIERGHPLDVARIVQLTHPDDRSHVEQTLKSAQDEQKGFVVEHRLVMADDSVKHLQVVARPMTDDAGHLEFVGSVMDITQRKRAEAAQRAQELEREAMQRQRQQTAKMEALGQLAGGIAHDFNNILGAILGYGELAQNEVDAGGAARFHVDQVMQAGARGKGLVDRILAFSRSGMGEYEPLPVQAVVEETLDLLAASLPHNVRLERQLAACDTAVVGDSTQFHEVAMNLCTNAVHSMAQGGVLTVVLARETVAERRLLSNGALSAGFYVRLSVKDTGSGIPPAVLERMFDPFFTTKRVGDGTGLGLALVNGIVADLGGAIDVATQVDVGTTFTIWLPATDILPMPLAEPAAQLPRGNGETVMIVDDEPALVALAEETLAQLGYEPVGFESSIAALQAFRAEPKRFDLVLTDERMPDLTGTEFAREILQLRPEISIILMSGYGGSQLSERAQAAGVVEVLRKPLVRRDIAEPIARALRPGN
jgi:predicted ATPase/signal transduction histidine kinase/GAF domain-containing protein/CheY-like chemotaxis protein